MRPFVMIEIDLYSELTPSEIVTYGWIKHRAGKNGNCWESLSGMVKHIPLKLTALKQAIAGLIRKKKIIKLETRKGKSDVYTMPFSTEPSRKTTTEPSRFPTTNNNSLQQEQITNSLSLTACAEFGEPERLKNAPEPEPEPEPAYASLANNQTALLEVDPNPVDGEKDFAASCSTIADRPQLKPHRPEAWGDRYDRRQGNRDRAQTGTWFKPGLTNKRWKDRQDFDKFVAYVEIYAENRRKDPELNPNGTKYGKNYRIAILSRTAVAQDENDPMLACWKTWNLEPAAPKYIESKPEKVATVDVVAEAAFQAKFAKLKADNQARRDTAAAEKVKKEEILRGLNES